MNEEIWQGYEYTARRFLELSSSTMSFHQALIIPLSQRRRTKTQAKTQDIMFRDPSLVT